METSRHVMTSLSCVKRRTSRNVMRYLLVVYLLISVVTIVAILNMQLSYTTFPRMADINKRVQNNTVKIRPLGGASKPTVVKPVVVYKATFTIMGRLGNNMFQYASMIGITSKLGVFTPVLPKTCRLFATFPHIRATVATPGDNVKYTTVWEDKYFGYYNNKTENIRTTGNLGFVGFFQSWKYFESVKDRIREEFRFSRQVVHQAMSTLQKYKNKYVETMKLAASSVAKVTFVGIHVRREDMTSHKEVAFGRSVPGANYFKAAMRKMKAIYETVVFVVCSDDIAWSKRTIGQSPDVFYSHYKDSTTDLAILSHCNHTIITVGSFGWWASWLVNGTTIYYADHLRKGSKLDKVLNPADYFYPGWIGLHEPL